MQIKNLIRVVGIQNEGKIFEQQWRKSFPKDSYFLRIKDSPSSFGQDSKFVRFTLKSPYDCFAFYKRTLFPMELKSTKNNSISIQRDKKEKGKMIKLNQIEGLTDCKNFDGIYPGFIFDFRKTNVYWMHISDFNKFINNSNKKSINEKDVIEYNGILINKHIKRTNYIYDVEKLLNDIMRKV